MKDKEKQNISMKEMLTKRSFEPITNCNCKVEKEIEAMKYFANKNAVSMFDIVNNCEHKEKQIKRNGYMFFSQRKKLADEYEEWVNKPLDGNSKIKDCPLSVITFMQIKGYRNCKDMVVLSREEYNELLLRGLNTMGDLVSSKIKNNYKEKIEKLEETINEEYADISDYKDLVRKETAEKILDKVDYESNGQTKQITDLLRKQFGVELKEGEQ